MKRFTERVIAAAMKEDDEITTAQASSALRILKGHPPGVIQSTGEQEQILVSTREAARLLSVSRQTLWRLEKAGTIKPIILGHVGGHHIKRYALDTLKQLAHYPCR